MPFSSIIKNQLYALLHYSMQLEKQRSILESGTIPKAPYMQDIEREKIESFLKKVEY